MLIITLGALIVLALFILGIIALELRWHRKVEHRTPSGLSNEDAFSGLQAWTTGLQAWVSCGDCTGAAHLVLLSDEGLGFYCQDTLKLLTDFDELNFSGVRMRL